MVSFLRLLPLLMVMPLLLLAGCKSQGDKKYEEAKELQKRQLNDEALVAFQEAANLQEKEDGGHPDRSYYRMASIYKGRGEHQKAADMYTLAIQFNPDDVKYYHRLMGVLIFLGRPDEALKYYEKIEDHPSLKYDIRGRQEIQDRYDEIQVELKKQEEAANAPAEVTPAEAAPSDAPAPANTDEATSSTAN